MGEARGTQPKMHGGAKSRQKKSQCKCCVKEATFQEKDVHPRQLVTNVTEKVTSAPRWFSKTITASGEELSLDTAFLRVLDSEMTSPWTVTPKLQALQG